MSLFNISTDVFGLDIGDLSLKSIFLKKRGGRIQLKSFGEKIVPAGYFDKGEIKKEKEVAQIIKGFVKEQRISTPYVVAVLPETKTFIKTIEIPQKDKFNIENNIEKEMERCVPMKMKEVYLNWKIINKQGEKIKVLVGLSAKKIVDSYINVLKMAGLRPISLEIESVAILRSLINKEECSSKALAIVDLGATRSSLIIINEEVIQLTVSLPLSGESLTQRIASNFKIAPEKAEAMKKNPENFPEQKANLEKEIAAFINELNQSLKNYLKFYEEGSDKKIEQIIVCGGIANLAGLIKKLENGLQIKTTKGNPWINLFKEKSPLSEEKSIIYATAIGLALKGLEESF